ncbi:hypothetical protein [Halostella salina]|uniref:hypothetical protein n=1 Tax=Halostella salina TaxID=1547897 RepID=UPI000EF83C94|nr:hypothetical protein [Halostella salina]
MSTSGHASTASRGSRRFVAVGVCGLVVWQAAVLAGVPRRTSVALGALGFVLHVVFGKAYALLPSYFDRRLAAPRAPAVHLPLSVAGVAGLAIAPLAGVPGVVGAVGATCWSLGVAVFVGVLAVTVRDNPIGAETGTGEANAHRRGVDRAANAALPVAVLYLAAGAYGTAAAAGVVPVPAALPALGLAATASHLLAAGGAALVLFAVGFRLLPRLLGASPPRPLVAVVLPAGALGPALVAAGVGGAGTLRAGAALLGVAVVGFAAAVIVLAATADRRRVGVGAVVAGPGFGVVGVTLGAGFAFGFGDAALVPAHLRLNLLGFLGLTVVGVTYHFYPPAVGRLPGVGERVARAAAAGIAGGLLVEVAGLWTRWPAAVVAGRTAGLFGALMYAWVVLGLFHERG